MYFLRGFSFSTGWHNIWHVVRDFLSLLRSQIMWRQCVMFVWKAMTIVLFFITVLFFIVCIMVNWLVMLMNAFLNCCPGHGWQTRNIQSRYKIFLNQIFSSCFREKSSTMHINPTGLQRRCSLQSSRIYMFQDNEGVEGFVFSNVCVWNTYMRMFRHTYTRLMSGCFIIGAYILGVFIRTSFIFHLLTYKYCRKYKLQSNPVHPRWRLDRLCGLVDDLASCHHGGFVYLGQNMLDDVFLCLDVQRSRVSVCDSFCFLRHGFIRAWTATHGAWPSPLISPFGDIHYFNCNGSQVGYS